MAGKGGFGKSGGGSTSMSSKLLKSVQSPAMVPKKGKMSGKKGY